MEDLVLRVTGMSCASCEQRIEAALGRVEGIRLARADHERDEVRVVFEPSRTSEDTVRAAVAAAGFEVEA